MNHPALLRLAEATRGSEYENKIFLVGGCVRDELLGLEPKTDFDLVITGDAVALADWIWEQGLSSIPPVTYPRFGTAMVQIEGFPVELVTARRENYLEESRKPIVEPASLDEDAKRRDFTINTLLRNLHSGQLIDPLGVAVSDLSARILAAPDDPVKLFSDDPLRMLRAVRFRWQLDLTPGRGLYEAVWAERERLKIISAERIRDEWSKMLTLPNQKAVGAMRDLLKLGLLEQFLPEFMPMVGLFQGGFHHLDVWEHTLLVVESLPETSPDKLVLVLAALFHDVSKPETRSYEGGKIRFFAHEVVGAKRTTEILSRLKFPGETIEAVTNLVKNHMRLATFHELSKPATRRLIRDTDGLTYLLLDLVEADCAALKPGSKTLDLNPIREAIETVMIETPPSQLVSPLNGEEIMALTGLPPGKAVGEIKVMLTEMVIEGELGFEDKSKATEIVLAKQSH
ncbi:MAG: HDIG domain-containing metalloprotein [Fimbriimonadaceae bacterium]